MLRPPAGIVRMFDGSVAKLSLIGKPLPITHASRNPYQKGDSVNSCMALCLMSQILYHRGPAHAITVKDRIYSIFYSDSVSGTSMIEDLA